MNITQQHIAPEDVMALLDGELSAAEIRVVRAHIQACAECARVVEQLRRTSQALSAWRVPEIPAAVERSVNESLTKAESVRGRGKPGLWVRASFWSRRHYAVIGLAAVSMLLIVVLIATPNLMLSKRQVTQTVDSYMPVAGERTVNGKSREVVQENPSANGSLGKLQSGGSGGGDRDSMRSLRGAQDALSLDADGEPMIARSLSLSVVTRDFAGARSALDAILGRYHGYSAELNVSTVENAPRSLQASLRIPAPALGAALNDLKRLGRVENESQSGEDVSRQHADLVARLKNSRETERRLRDILGQRTGKIGEVLQVEREIARVRGEIEQMEAEQKSLEHRVDFATVELQLAEEYKAELNPPSASVFGRIRNAFIAGYRHAADAVLGILLFFAEFGPALVILALPLALLWRRYRRVRATV